MMVLIDMLGLMRGYKSIIKRSALFIPVIGWFLWLTEWISLKRSFVHDKPVIERKVAELLTFPYPVTLTFFPEGTRFTTEKQKASAKFAEANGLTPLKHVLAPRTKGFTTLLPIIRGSTKSIFDATWMFTDGISPSLKDLLNRTANSKDMHILLKRIPIEKIPSDEKNACKWLHELYVEKDKRIERFLETGYFEGEKRLLKPGWSSYVGVSLTGFAALYIIQSLWHYVLLNKAWGVLIGIIVLLVLCK